MKILMDTHIAIWLLGSSEKIPAKAIGLVEDSRNQLYVSVVSCWEASIKHMKNPHAMPVSGALLREASEAAGYSILDIKARHVDMLEMLDCSAAEGRHADPFDRMLIAQSKSEGMLFLTHDKLLALYDEPLVRII